VNYDNLIGGELELLLLALNRLSDQAEDFSEHLGALLFVALELLDHFLEALALLVISNKYLEVVNELDILHIKLFKFVKSV